MSRSRAPCARISKVIFRFDDQYCRSPSTIRRSSAKVRFSAGTPGPTTNAIGFSSAPRACAAADASRVRSIARLECARRERRFFTFVSIALKREAHLREDAVEARQRAPRVIAVFQLECRVGGEVVA